MTQEKQFLIINVINNEINKLAVTTCNKFWLKVKCHSAYYFKLICKHLTFLLINQTLIYFCDWILFVY